MISGVSNVLIMLPGWIIPTAIPYWRESNNMKLVNPSKVNLLDAYGVLSGLGLIAVWLSIYYSPSHFFSLSHSRCSFSSTSKWVKNIYRHHFWKTHFLKGYQLILERLCQRYLWGFNWRHTCIRVSRLSKIIINYTSTLSTTHKSHPWGHSFSTAWNSFWYTIFITYHR